MLLVLKETFHTQENLILFVTRDAKQRWCNTGVNLMSIELTLVNREKGLKVLLQLTRFRQPESQSEVTAQLTLGQPETRQRREKSFALLHQTSSSLPERGREASLGNFYVVMATRRSRQVC